MTDIEQPTFGFVGGRLCLDFCNTVGSRTTEHPNERLRRFEHLITWSKLAGIVSDDEAQQFADAAADRPADALATFDHALSLREAIYRIFSAVAAKKTPQAADLDPLNRTLSEAMAQLELTNNVDGFGWRWRYEPGQFDRLLWPVARSAADLLTSADLSKVRECANETCGWLFLDLSRNHSRRWCDMSDCGNRAKARRHYERKVGKRSA